MESLDYDLLVVGAGPAGLACAIRFKALTGKRVCILEKGSEVGAHSVSGAILEPSALDQLLPHWDQRYPYPKTKVKRERFSFLTEKTAVSVPQVLLPKNFKNKGDWILSLSQLTRFLAQEAEALDIDLFPAFAGRELLFENDKVIGVNTGDAAVLAPYTVLAEGPFGTLSEEVMTRFALRGAVPQHYALGIKEVWDVSPKHHEEGFIHHMADPKQDNNGGFLYHLPNNKVALGWIVSLAYEDPLFSPYDAFQAFKKHPVIAPVLEGGTALSYGAKALAIGGLHSLPECTFPGGVVIGCAAGFLNTAKLKGIHTAMISGMMAAEALAKDQPFDITNTPLYEELYHARNMKAWQKKGALSGSVMVGIDQLFLKGKGSLTLPTPDFQTLHQTTEAPPVNRAPILESLFLSGTHHSGSNHLTIIDEARFHIVSRQYGHPETRFCPAAVYEREPFRIHFENCLHCKTCAIKDPSQMIVWTLPLGGDGPEYTDL